jgi:SIR2-like domain
VLFALTESAGERELSYLERLQQQRDSKRPADEAREVENTGERFVKGFLRYALDIGYEHGYGSTGRSGLNKANAYLAALLEAQQTGRGWCTRAFCRTIFTTNFDTLLQNSLQMVNLLYAITDRPQRGLDRSEFAEEETAIHLVYTHGSILRHNPASTTTELGQLSKQNVSVLQEYLESRDVITIGYSGWNDSLMDSLRRCNRSRHHLYWCGIDPEPPPNIANLLDTRSSNAAYVYLGPPGADGLLCSLYEALVTKEAQRDPMQRYRQWAALGSSLQ